MAVPSAPTPESNLYRQTLGEYMQSGGGPGFINPRAREIVSLFRQRFALSNETGDAFDRTARPGDAELFALASELEFWLTF